VNSGFPDQRHFTLSADRYNFPGLDAVALPVGQGLGARVTIRAQVGDRYSNPVLPGTVVYFSTLHGIISTKDGPTDGQFGVTDDEGFVSQFLMAGNPRPEGPNVLPGLGPGYSYVYAQTLGENATRVIDSILVLWTGKPIITKTDTITSFNLGNGGSAGPFTFTVADRYGNPMSPGTRIVVEAPGLSVSPAAYADLTLPDTFVRGPGTTTFSLIVTDGDPANVTAAPVPTQVTVTVIHQVYGTLPVTLARGTFR
jgi:hypothetical protein